jgi:glycosyltransferase involved in cell wall biosynthesis
MDMQEASMAAAGPLGAAPEAGPSSRRICIAHEWLVAYAGSERCVEEMLRLYPEAALLTTLVRPERIPARLGAARPSVLQRIPGAAAHHEWLLPLMPLAWRLSRPDHRLDAVITSSHACAKAVRVPAGVPHLCYCHTPMRYAWDFSSERHRLPRSLRPAARVGASAFRRWDRRTSRSVTRFVANSRAVAARIARAYGRHAEIIHPPVRTDFFTPGDAREDFFLYVGRLVSYKRPDLVVDAFAGLRERLVVVGEGHFSAELRARATPNVTFVSGVDDHRLRDLYRRARALVFPGEEDFGITMAEAQSCGTPVIGLRAGGAPDIVRHGDTGWLIARQDVEELRSAVRRAAVEDLDPSAIRANALRFSSTIFRERLSAAVEDMIRDPAPI